jgi:hypothetical protein
LLAAPAAGSYGRVYNPVPVVTLLSPASIAAHKPAGEVIVTGKNFLSTSSATFNGVPRAVKLLEPNKLALQLKPVDLAEPGIFQVVVTNPAPGGGAAASRFTVTPPDKAR